jgi:hypothetical protein
MAKAAKVERLPAARPAKTVASQKTVRSTPENTALRAPPMPACAYSGVAARVEVLPPAERISLRAPAASVAAACRRRWA